LLHIDTNAAGQISVRPHFYSSIGVDDSGDEVIQARLRVLARRGRYDEYLAFARLMGEPLAYTTMLIERGRLDEAATYGREHLRTADGALALARALLAKDAPTLAFTVAERGLTLGGRKSALAQWLRGAADDHGATALALAAALALYEEEISLDNYLAAQRLAGDDWPQRRDSAGHCAHLALPLRWRGTHLSARGPARRRHHSGWPADPIYDLRRGFSIVQGDRRRHHHAPRLGDPDLP
jgi:hypothetical protein